MRKMICCPLDKIPQEINDDLGYISLCQSSGERREGVGHIAITLKRDIRRAGLVCNPLSWDFAMIALSIAAADESFNRKTSADGWTRQIDIDINLADPSPWRGVKEGLEKTFHLLTGDYWKLNFQSGGETPPDISGKNIKTYDASSIALVSGGVDSLVGAIDLIASGEKPLFVSKVVKGDAEKQKDIVCALDACVQHLQWSCAIRKPYIYISETSTRGRSIVFFAYAILAASAIKSSDPVTVYVPENGFISLNVAMNPGRMGSFSTKTTHPIYLNGLQQALNSAGINIQFKTPYKFKTKGEMLAESLDQELLQRLIGNTTSCGRFGTYKRTHCGRCLPCMVRRAAFLKSGIIDSTVPSVAWENRKYVFQNLSQARRVNGPDDIGAVAGACLALTEYGIDRFIGGSLAFAKQNERQNYAGVVERGLIELTALLKQDGVL